MLGPNGDNTNDDLLVVEDSNQTTYSSLLGVPVVGLQQDANSTFTLDTGYFAFQCNPMVSYNLEKDLQDFLRPLQFYWLNGSQTSNESEIVSLVEEARERWSNVTDWRSPGLVLTRWFLDTNTPLIHHDISLLSNDTPLNTFDNTPDPAKRPFFPNITFASPTASWTDDVFNHWSVTNCSMGYVRVEANASCIGLSCRIVSMRRVPLNDFWPGYLMDVTLYGELPHLVYDYFQKMCHYFPLATFGPASSGSAYTGINWGSAAERYLSGSEYPFSYFEAQFLNNTNLSNVPLDDFTLRFSTLFNTYWQTTLATEFRMANLSLDETNQYEAVWWNLTSSEGYVPLTPVTNATFTRAQTVYKSERTWLGLFLAASIVLQICAIAGHVLECLCIGPDILGYVSTMTRDNAYTPLPSAASALSGHERARLLKNYHVQLADAKPGSQEGHVALCAVGKGVQYRGLSKRRRYE